MNLLDRTELYRALCALYSRERVTQTVEALKELEKTRRYSAFGDSTAWCMEVLEKAGFSQVRRIAHKADGREASFDFIMPQAWDLLGRSTLEIVEPVRRCIADTDLSTIHVSEYSAPTPAGGVTAELVDYAALDSQAPDCRGKYVFYRGYLPAQHPLYHSLAAAGCVGIVYAPFEATTHEPDKTAWTNGHGHIGWYHLKEDAVVPTFCVTPRQGIELLQLLAKGKVILHGEMNTKLYDGEIYTVTAVLPGKSAEEVALLGHLYEPFRADDCQGFAVGVEAALLLKKLMDDGVLPPPEKTLRLVFSMERYGFAAFYANHDRKTLAAMSIDTVTCLASRILNMGTIIMESPLSLPFFGDMLLQKAMDTCCPEVKWSLQHGNLSDDCWMGEPSVDIPTNWVRGSCSDGKNDYHHCDAPIFDAVDHEDLAKLVPMLTACTAELICGNAAYFAALAGELEAVAADWLEKEKNSIAGMAAVGRLTGTDAAWRIQAAQLLYLGRMDSFNRFYPGLVTPALSAHWADSFLESLPGRELTAAEAEAAAVRYRVATRGLPFSLARVPAQERVCWPNVPELVWALLNPERSVLDAVRLRDAVHFTETSDEEIRYYLAYFRYLAKYGYLENVN